MIDIKKMDPSPIESIEAIIEMAVFFNACLDFINRHSLKSSKSIRKTRPEQGKIILCWTPWPAMAWLIDKFVGIKGVGYDQKGGWKPQKV